MFFKFGVFKKYFIFIKSKYKEAKNKNGSNPQFGCFFCEVLKNYNS